MKKGEFIRGYKLLDDFKMVGGGMCRWTFAEKDGKQYFVKEFLAPTYPTDDAPGSAKTKEEKRIRCEAFEKHHNAIRSRIASKVGSGGNLIYTVEFFRFGAKYYKVTDKVDVATLQIKDIAKLPIEKRILILKTIAHSLRILHNDDIVHGDLKPDNILIKVNGNNYIAKLIDFDNSYFSGKPTATPEEIVGDMVYYSPELASYIQGSGGIHREDLQLSSDIFALGLIYCQYLTSDLPTFDTKWQYPCAAVNNGVKLQIRRDGLPRDLCNLVNSMLERTPIARPSIAGVFDQLKTLNMELDSPTNPPVALRMSSSLAKDPPPDTKLKGKGLNIGKDK